MIWPICLWRIGTCVSILWLCWCFTGSTSWTRWYAWLGWFPISCCWKVHLNAVGHLGQSSEVSCCLGLTLQLLLLAESEQCDVPYRLLCLSLLISIALTYKLPFKRAHTDSTMVQFQTVVTASTQYWPPLPLLVITESPILYSHVPLFARSAQSSSIYKLHNFYHSKSCNFGPSFRALPLPSSCTDFILPLYRTF